MLGLSLARFIVGIKIFIQKKSIQERLLHT